MTERFEPAEMIRDPAEETTAIREQLLTFEGWTWDASADDSQGWRSPHDDLRRSFDAAWADHVRRLVQLRSR